jgi:hypothetical protein
MREFYNLILNVILLFYYYALLIMVLPVKMYLIMKRDTLEQAGRFRFMLKTGFIVINSLS